MSHEDIIGHLKRLSSSEYNIVEHPTSSLKYILKYSLMYQEYNLSKIINDEINRRSELSICEWCNISKPKINEYCYKCNEAWTFLKESGFLK